MSFHHVALFRWIDTTTEEQVAAIVSALNELPDAIPEVVRFRCGADAGLAPGNWDFAVTTDFADEQAFAVYRDHPVHRAVITDHIAPVLAERVAVQFSATHDSG